MKTILLTLTLGLLMITGCGLNQKKADKAANSSTADKNLRVFKSINDSLQNDLMVYGATYAQKAMLGIKSKLVEAMKKGGPNYALEFCNVKAIPITDSLANDMNVEIKRVAKKYRNPANETKGVENAIYKDYVMNFIEGKPTSDRLEIDANGHPVFYKLIKVNQECLVCHGSPNTNIPPNVAAQIKLLYPNDKATDFTAGQPRGMWAITFNDILIQTEKP